MYTAGNIGMTLIDTDTRISDVTVLTHEQSILIGGLIVVAVISFIYAVKAYFKIRKLKKK